MLLQRSFKYTYSKMNVENSKEFQLKKIFRFLQNTAKCRIKNQINISRVGYVKTAVDSNNQY